MTLLAATLYFDNPVSLSVFGQGNQKLSVPNDEALHSATSAFVSFSVGSIWFALSFFALMFLGIGFYVDVSTADPGYVRYSCVMLLCSFGHAIHNDDERSCALLPALPFQHSEPEQGATIPTRDGMGV